ncbi:MAG: hypothetical protein M3163_16125 [Actinomycetota bacterium]|nr:hypothetical protein [Actinomycetota bacterium]
MADEEIVWPWGMDEGDPDPASRPWVFNPVGFLLAVLADTAEAERARQALQAVGFPEGHSRTFSGEQVLEDRARFEAQQGTARRLVEKVTIDTEAFNLLLNYAHAGRAFVWIRTPERDDANRAIRGLSAHQVLYFRYYGDAGVEEIRMP